jgi:hypothetical protein
MRKSPTATLASRIKTLSFEAAKKTGILIRDFMESMFQPYKRPFVDFYLDFYFKHKQ